ncbi:MAG TPA: acetylornithine deacetylase [Segeticoccus sp.]|uniref:acetylornithine deacetylase n=1 Tax=Segeticoccus sp. TaxID=2706531 RepID=UPI002D7F1A00|nr:acetylornithine deacetylase [Segeticoccus sp.]HET8601902.1 acetylornithine deacetylase [Segeticoccus sp.]
MNAPDPSRGSRDAAAGPAQGSRAPRSLPEILRLVALDTTSRNSNLELIGLVRDQLAEQGVTAHVLPNGDGRKANLVATIPAHDGTTAGGIVLSGHTDVVPVDGQEWSSEPFEAEVRDERLYGRGTCDMKSFLGVVLHTVPTLLAAKLSEPVHLAFSYDEEVGCGGGAALVEALPGLGLSPRICIVGEPSSMRVVAAHKSINLVNLHFRGVAAHSSLTPQGVNAIEYAARAIASIRDMADEFRQSGPFDDAYVVPSTTASVNVIEGGIASNTVAERCDVQLEFRSISASDPAQIVDRICQRCAELEQQMRAENPAASVEVEVVAQVPGLDTDGASPAIPFAVELGGTRSSDKVTYGTEAGLFQAAGIETVVCGPGDIAQAHAPNEFIELSQIERCEEFLASLVRRLDTGDDTAAGSTTEHDGESR